MKNYHREITEKSIKKAEMRTYLAPHPKITHNPHRIKSMAYKEMFYICSRITVEVGFGKGSDVNVDQIGDGETGMTVGFGW
jgi:tRNA G46 methylase TrmB